MCNKRNSTKISKLRDNRNSIKVDNCLANIVDFINNFSSYETLSCCCGHGIYPPTIVIQNTGTPMFPKLEVFSMKTIPRARRFYLKDKQGFYYIPEVKQE